MKEKRDTCPLCGLERDEVAKTCPRCSSVKGQYPPPICVCRHCEKFIQDESGFGAGACVEGCPFENEK